MKKTCLIVMFAVMVVLLLACSAGLSEDDLAGTWVRSTQDYYAIFNEDGTCSGGPTQEHAEAELGPTCEFWFVGQQFHIVDIKPFPGSAENQQCGEIEGVYNVELLDDGSLQFIIVDDECMTRAVVMQGGTEGDLKASWERVE